MRYVVQTLAVVCVNVYILISVMSASICFIARVLIEVGFACLA